ncbi:MAG TPA: glycosyltransferase family 9 protein [Candidatus Krumholzibacteria bacterium]|nr:glycosyltransferase family 9 protein [Candidatus Krumholzibacteria bacterium]
MLFVQSGDLTDLLFAAPVLTGLQRTYPRCRVGVLVQEDASELIRHHPHVHDMLLYRPGQMRLAHPAFFRLVRQLRRRAYDMIIHMGESPPPSHEVLGYLSGAPVRLGPARERSYPYVNCELRWNPEKSGYEGRRLAEVCGLLGVQPEEDLRTAVLTEQDLRFARQLVHFRKPRADQLLIGVDPGKGKANTRVLDRTLAYLLHAIYQRYRSKVIVLATPEEDEAAQRFEQGLQCERIELPRHNVKDVVALLSQCDLFLAGNTNLLHFAVAFGVPTLGLFTERDDPRWTPPEAGHFSVLQGQRGTRLSLETFLAQVERLLSLPARR